MSGEDDLIARAFAPIAGPGALGLLDDAALLALPPGHDLVVTGDALVAGVHFFPADPPGSVALKALGVNLSDLAAKAATPLGFLLVLALPHELDPAWVDRFAAALGTMAGQAGCPLVGGDTVSTPGPLTVSITAFGTVEAGAMLRRTSARVGDRLYVSGTIGDGALGLAVRAAELGGASPAPAWVAALDPAQRAHLCDRYLHPRPRLALVPALRLARAGMDISDGLVGDCAKMLGTAGVSGRIAWERVPLSAAARAALDAEPTLRETVLTGGDDYEVLAAVAPERSAAFEAAAAAAGLGVTAIGTVTDGHGPPLMLDEAGTALSFSRTAYSHL